MAAGWPVRSGWAMAPGPADRAAVGPQVAVKPAPPIGLAAVRRVDRAAAVRRWVPAAVLRLRLRRHRVEHRPDVQPSGLSEVACLAAVVAGHRDDQVVTVDDHLRPGHSQPVDPRADDLLRLCQRFPARGRAVRCARGQRDPGAALQVNAEFGGGVLVPGEKHQQIDADQHHQEHRQVTGRVHRRRRRCHVPCISSRISFLPPTEPTCRAGARRASGSSVPVGRLPVRNRWSPGARRPRRQHPCQGPR